jgi:glutaredoxin
MLFRQLDKHGIAHERVNIWEDPDAAATVRSIANGNETVPTVVVGGSKGMVNPSVTDVKIALEALAGN